jgi:transcriptional regulator GlxA family with amidase domain
MTERSGLTPRTFARRFQTATGRRPIDYVHALRIEGARQRLESGDDSVDDVGFAGSPPRVSGFAGAGSRWRVTHAGPR